jgi:chondroitin sulfate proteoglycan 4
VTLFRDRVFACGTNAFNPKCSWRNIQEISRVIKSVDGRAKCPYSPHSNITAMMTGANGDYYIASEIDSSSNDPAIYRMAAGGTKGK